RGIKLIIADTEESAVFDLKWTIEAVANIVDNGIKYTKRGGSVKIQVESYSSFVRMDVTDNGIGIAETEQASVFNRFYRSEMVSEEPGVGIGLYLAREVMKAQDGYIKVSSRIGDGSQFSLFFLKEEISQN
ncbi:ATP-binding protein, partial [Romboutsia ilealis]|nr:ATP-binding protein [Romboutsia ilealis]